MAEGIMTQLRDERRLLGWSVREVARRTGLSHSLIGEWESGQRVPTLTSVVKYAEAVGRPLQLAPREES